MHSKFKFIFFTSIILIVSHVYAVTCQTDQNAPVCPSSGSTLLDDTYPAKAYVISNSAVFRSTQSSKVTTQFITALAKSYNFERVPQVLIPVNSIVEFENIKAAVQTSLKEKNIKKEKIDEILSQLTHVKSESYTWQQDYFESFIDLNTGMPVLREFDSYTRNLRFLRGSTKNFQVAGNECQITVGDKITTDHIKYFPTGDGRSFAQGEMGGNVEGAPGGLCMTGDNQSFKVSEQYCGKKENIIQLQTSWLSVGHVDEIFKIIPSHFNDGRPSQCQFTLMAASPKKALELLNQSNLKNDSFYSFSSSLNAKELSEAKKSRSMAIVAAAAGNKIICNYIREAINDGSMIPKSENKNAPSAQTVLMKYILETAKANENISEEDFKCEDFIDQVPNSIIHNAIQKDLDILHLNMAIQESIENDRKLIKSRILERLPECTKYYDEMDAPNLFYGAFPIEKNGHFTLPTDKVHGGAIDSFMPNPTNSVVMNRSLLLSESGNTAFDNYMEKELNKRKIEVNKIDTWDYAHVGKGNMHCSSHTIPYCRPR